MPYPNLITEQQPSEAGSAHALMRLTGLSLEETMAGLHPESEPVPQPEVLIQEVLSGEAMFTGVDVAPFLLPAFYFRNLVTAVSAAGVIPVVRDLDACMQALSRFELNLPEETRVGPSLAPFAKGLVLLAVAESMRDDKGTTPERVFGANGKAHAAALRQVLNPTQNKQAHRRRASIEMLAQNPNPMAIEAWRAFETWAMVSPDERTLQGLVAKLEGAPEPFDPAYSGWREAALARMGQAHLNPILPKEPEPISVFGLGKPMPEAQRRVVREVLRKGLDGRCTTKPNAPGTQLPAWHTVGAWKAMLGSEDALALAGELTTNMVLTGTPFLLSGGPETRANEEPWIEEGLRLFARSFAGEAEFPLAYAMYAAVMTEWDRLNRYPWIANPNMQARAAVIRDHLGAVDEVLDLLERDLPLENAPWVEANAVVYALALALLGAPGIHAKAALARVVAFADAHGIDLA